MICNLVHIARIVFDDKVICFIRFMVRTKFLISSISIRHFQEEKNSRENQFP